MLHIAKNLPTGISLEDALVMTEKAKTERRRKTHLECLKRYNEKNREELRQRQKEYYETHKIEINARRREARARARGKSQGATTPGEDLHAE